MKTYDEHEPANPLKSPEEIEEIEHQRDAAVAEWRALKKNLQDRGWAIKISIFGHVTRYRLDYPAITAMRGKGKDEWNLMRQGELVSTHATLDEALDAGDAIKGIAPAISNM